MPEEKNQPVSLQERATAWTQQMWRPVATSVAVALILLFGWGVFNGKHGLSAWAQQRHKDKQLQKDINDLKQENDRLRSHVDRLKSDPNAIEHEAREQLHYAKPGEVIYSLSDSPKPQQSSDSGK